MTVQLVELREDTNTFYSHRAEHSLLIWVLRAVRNHGIVKHSRIPVWCRIDKVCYQLAAVALELKQFSMPYYMLIVGAF